MFSLEASFQGIFLASLFLSMIYIVGVIWRVEGELDLSYKFLSLAVFILLIGEMFRIFSPVFFEWASLVGDGLRAIFGCLFLASIYFMRDVVRKEDGELGNLVTQEESEQGKKDETS
ncbi:MAG: hypothetical protein KBB51_00975 [Candidatus Moranbacteria bacterium]|jgi:hypothetical protein|nr:hypothetical protein [Candidatus Moranbacteria bacterium]